MNNLQKSPDFPCHRATEIENVQNLRRERTESQMRRDSHFQINREWTFGRAKLVHHLYKIINIMFKSRSALKQIVIVAFSKFQKLT